MKALFRELYTEDPVMLSPNSTRATVDRWMNLQLLGQEKFYTNYMANWPRLSWAKKSVKK